MDSKKQLSGLKAKRNGDMFENLIIFFSARAGFRFIKIPSGCKRVSKDKLIQVKSPFDFILVSDEVVIFCDAKSVVKNTFGYAAIDQSQLMYLDKVKNKYNHSGYIVNLNGNVCFFSIDKLKAVSPSNGLSIEDGIYLGEKDSIDFNVLKSHRIASI